MSEIAPEPPHACPACGAGHYAPVRFCPFCGAAQARPEPARTAPPPSDVPATPVPAPPQPLLPASPQPPAQAAPQPSRPTAPPPAAPPPRAASPVPPAAPGPSALPPTKAPWRRPRRRFRVRIRHAVLAILAIAGLAWLAARRETLPPPSRVAIGPGWTAVSLAPYRAAPLLRLTADVPFTLRIDGERVTRAVPGAGAVLRPRALRALELRSGRGQITVTLTPRAE